MTFKERDYRGGKKKSFLFPALEKADFHMAVDTKN